MDTVKSNNEPELTSTMGNVLSTSSKDEKNDTSDATPTSSTDANRTSSASQIVSDDPISSTSSDIVEQSKTKTSDVTMQNSVDVVQATSQESHKSSSTDHEADLLEMSISGVPREKITEDVEDLVHDLESLLGESTDSFNVPLKRKEDCKPSDVKESAHQPQVSEGDQEVLSSGDVLSNKDDEKNEDLDNLQTETGELKNLEKELSQDFKPDDEIHQDVKCAADDEGTSKESDDISKEACASSDICIEQSNLNAEATEATKIEEENDMEKNDNTLEALNDELKEKNTDLKVQKESDDEIEGETKDAEEEYTGISKDEPEEDKSPVDSKLIDESEIVAKIETTETEIEDLNERETPNDEISKEVELEETLITNSGTDEPTSASQSVNIEEIVDNVEHSEENTEEENNLKDDSKSVEEVNKIEDVEKNREYLLDTKHEEDKSEQLLEEVKLQIKVGPSGDSNLELEQVTKSVQEVVNKEQEDDIKPADDLQFNANAHPTFNESNICDNQEELTEAAKDTLEIKNEGILEDQSLENLTEENDEETRQESSLVAEDKPIESHESKDGNNTIIDTVMPVEIENRQNKEEVKCEEVSNTEIIEDPQASVCDDQDNQPVTEKSDIKSPEDTKETSPELLDSDVKTIESQVDVPEEESVIETKESEPEIVEMVSAPDTPPESDSRKEISADTDLIKSPVSDVKESSSEAVLIEDEPEGIVSEPDQLKASSKKECKESEVEIVEITEDTKIKTTEEAEVTEGLVTEVYEPDNVGDGASNIPEIVVEPPEDTEKEVVEDVVIEEIQPQEEPEEIEDTVNSQEIQSKSVGEQETIEQEPLDEENVVKELENSCEESETSLPEEIDTQEKQKISDTTPEMPEENVAIKDEDNSDKMVCTVEDEPEASTALEEVPLKDLEADEVPESIDEMPDTTKQNEEAVTTIDDSIKLQTDNLEAVEEDPDVTEVLKPEEVSLPSDQILESVAHEIPIVDTSTTEEIVKSTDEAQKTSEPVVQTPDIPIDDTIPDTDDIVKETPDDREVSPSNELKEIITAVDEITTSYDAEISQIIEETPSSSNQYQTNNEIDSSVQSAFTKEVLEVDEETSKTDMQNEIIEDSPQEMVSEITTEAAIEVQIGVDGSESEEVTDQNAEVENVPDLSSAMEPEVVEKPIDQNRVIEISDDDSKPMESGEGDYVQVLSSEGDSDSEEMVPILALEPDENNLSPSELGAVRDDTETEKQITHSLDVASVSEPLPEIEEILADEGQVDEEAASIDMQENLETILAVASLQNADSTEVDTVVEPQISEKEMREMEALRKAVESITENPAVELEEEVDNVVDELMKVDIPLSSNLVETVEVQGMISEDLENKVDVVTNNEEVITIEDIDDAADKTEQVESDTDQDVPELRIEDSEDAQESEENVAVENITKDSSEGHSPPNAVEVEPKEVLPDSSQVVLVSEVKQSEAPKETKNRNNERSRRHKKSLGESKLEELSINVDVPDREKPYSPKVTIKPIKVPDDEVSTTSNSDSEIGKGSLKMTITKQSDKMHSILKICDPETLDAAQEPDEPIPKLIIKPKMQQVEQQHSPKMSTRSSKQMYSPTSSTQRSSSPRITIKPVVKPDKVESISPLKIKIKPDDCSKKHNPKLTIKPVMKSEEDTATVQTPRKVIIKPVVKPADEPEQVHSPRITIKPIPKPEPEKELEDKERSSPKITIKPIVKPQEADTQATSEEEEIKERIVLKINKGNLPTAAKDPKKREHPSDDDKSEKLAKITVKFSKGGGHAHIVQQSEESNKRTHEEPVTPEKTKKQKTDVETSISTRSKHKENIAESSVETRSKQKEQSPSHETTRSKHKDNVTESPIEAKRAKMKETESPLYESTRSRHKEHNVHDKAETSIDDADVRIIETKLDSPIVISEDSRSQDSGSCVIVEDAKDPLASIPVFEIRPEPKAMTPKQDSAGSVPSTPSTPSTPTPRKRGRPRKVPIVVREEFKEQEEQKPEVEPKEEEPKPVQESGRPKRSCRGQSVRATLGIKPRKPRGPGRGRGSKRGMGTRAIPMKPESEPKLSKAKLKLMQESVKEEIAKAKIEQVEHEKQPVLQCLLSNIEIKAPAPVLAPPEISPIEVPASPPASLPVPSPQAPVASPVSAPAASPKSVPERVSDLTTGEGLAVDSVAPSTSTRVSGEIVMVDEETRMSADTNSRAQTPAKQVPADVVIEESQSSVQSTATTESGKAASSRPNKAPRLEVQDPEGAVISADQLTEYYWNGNGPFMLQEQVAQFLGIKSFKRKYPGIMRRMLDMQERDFIRESGLASEHMCDLGLTAVNSADILDIMYSDFQEKYEEYCKHQRDRQAKDLINKQKALSLAASQEKNKADITEQAVQSAAQWNATFNKARKEQRKACMDLQTLTVHYPKGKLKQINKNKIGNYPVALVPGQFTDYYKEFTPTEINNLPINTMCYDPINIIPPEESDDSGSEGSDSDSDSTSSSSGSGSDSSSGVEDCKLCKHSSKKTTPNK